MLCRTPEQAPEQTGTVHVNLNVPYHTVHYSPLSGPEQRPLYSSVMIAKRQVWPDGRLLYSHEDRLLCVQIQLDRVDDETKSTQTQLV